MSQEVLGVWNEVRVGPAGVSVSLYAEWDDGTVTVEDETWFTHDELSVETGFLQSLNLTDGTSSALFEPTGADPDGTVDTASPDDQPVPNVGDRLHDTDPPDWSDGWPLVEVTDVFLATMADEYTVETKLLGDNATVADVNPSFPENDYIVLGQYVQTDGSLSDKEYAFPRSRLTY